MTIEEINQLREEYKAIKFKVDTLKGMDRVRYDFVKEYNTLLPQHQESLQLMFPGKGFFHIDSEPHRFQGVLINTKHDIPTSTVDRHFTQFLDSGLITRFKRDEAHDISQRFYRVYTIWFAH